MVGISTARSESQDGRPCGTRTSQASTWKVWGWSILCLMSWALIHDVRSNRWCLNTLDKTEHKAMRSFCGFFHPTLTSETFYMIQVLGLAFVSNLNDFFSTRQTVKRVLLYYFPSGVQVAGEGRGAWDGSPLPWPCQKTNGACEKTGDTCFRRVSSFASKITCIENVDCGYYLIWHFFAGKQN